ncbi:MAG: DUF1036 domain-containing protein [Pseudomonadota bacterium]
MAQVQSFIRGLAALLLLGLLYGTIAHTRAQTETGWQVCNETSYVVEAAAAHHEGQGTVVNGWTRLRPGACETVLEGQLTPGVHYLYGRSSAAHRGGRRVWGGDFPLCIDPTGSFSIETLPDCSIMGLEAREFMPVLIERRNRWTTKITETEKRTLEQASAAGVQRLLDNAGIYSGRIDGFLGRKTRAAIGDFLRANELSAETADADLIDILEQTAIERSRNVGLTFCNRTDKRIWSAMARRRGEGWESRGWWLLEAGGCARVIDEPLLQAEHFAYAEMELGEGEITTLRRGTDPFCVSRAKFAITGNESCETAAYRTGLFVATPAPSNRKLVYEFFERDFVGFGAGNAG